ncbi:MAG: primase-helicase family protein, partial [Candidatus Heimdallarchaeaceae archaeon]
MAIILKEKINTERALYLLGLDEDDYAKEVWNKQNDWQGEKEMSKETYCRLSYNWIRMMVENEGEYNVKYTFSRKMKDDGRMYVDGKFGVPQCKKNLRGFLCDDFYLDYDMKNAHPCILRYILKTYYECDFEKDFPAFNDYINNRDRFIRESKLDKTDILTLMNDSKYGDTSCSTQAQWIDKEFKEIQKIIYTLPEPLQKYARYKEMDLGKNRLGKFMNKLLVIFENKILQEIVQHFKDEGKEVSSLIYDGLHLLKEWGDQTEIMNQISEKYGVVWDIKEFDSTIKNTDRFQNYNPEHGHPPAYEAKSYKKVKERLEKTCFFIRDTAEYGMETKTGYNVYSKAQFQDVTASYIFESGKRGFPEEFRIFHKWQEDPERRTYEKIDFIPNLDECPEDVYNTFTGFTYGNYDMVDFDYKPQAIEIFKKQISRLVNHEEHVLEYFINYFAHMFQKPYENPEICLVIKSREGLGKDLLTGLLFKLLGNGLAFKTGEARDIFGNFNKCIKNRLLIQLNEMSGKDGFEYKDKIKHFITAENITIQEKGKNHYDQSNYARWIFCTNNLTPIELKADSRRFVVVSAQPVVPKKEEFADFIEMLNDEDSLYTLSSFLFERDISDFNIREIPVTKIAKEMAKANVSPVYLYLDEILKDDYYKELLDGEYENYNENVCFNVSTFKTMFQFFCKENELQFANIPTKVYYALMNEIGISKVKLR